MDDKKFQIDPRRDSYATFYDKKWANDILDAAQGTIVEEAVFTLCQAWKAAGNTYILPSLGIGILQKHFDACRNDDVATAILRSLLSRYKEHFQKKLPPDFFDEFKTLIFEIQTSVARGKLSSEFDGNQVWIGFLKELEFQLSIWGSQRLVYGALFYAYEYFLLQCYRIKTTDSAYRLTSYKTFCNDFQAAFGTDLLDSCLSDRQIQNARLVRHSLVHNGGRMTDELRPAGLDIHVVDDELQIMAPHTRKLFNVLKAPALMLTMDFGKSGGGARNEKLA